MTKQNIAWIDLLRVVACFLVVLAHCCDPFVSRFDSNPTEFLSGAFLGSMLRSCVPLFVMISGVLLIPVKMDMNTFYRKRLSRVLIPLFVWSVVTPILYFLYLNSGITTTNPGIAMENHTWDASLNKILNFPFNFNYDTTPLWYLYMLVGIYLITPIISSWLTQASKKDIKTFLGIWAFTTLLPLIQMTAPAIGYHGNYGNMGLLGVCDWNPYGTFYYFSGFIGYVVLAYYMVRFPLNWSWSKTLTIAIALWLVGFAITYFGFVLTQKYYPGSYPQLEIIWYFSGVNVLMMTYAIFMVMQKVKIKSSPLLTQLSALTFGVYLTHFLVVQIVYDFVYTTIKIPAILQIPLIAVITFVITSLFVWLLSKLPKSKYYIG